MKSKGVCAIAQKFAAEGWLVGIGDRNSLGLEETKALLPEGRCHCYTFDVTNDGDVTVTGVSINEISFDLTGNITITPPADTTLSPDETQQWTGVRVLSQADIDAIYQQGDGDGFAVGDVFTGDGGADGHAGQR